MNIDKKGFYILNVILILTIVIAYYKLVDIKTLIAALVTPAFIISASLSFKSKKGKVISKG